ncbi:MAG: WD40 repeat domain-containing protein, partial [Planctomycetota bacterium]
MVMHPARILSLLLLAGAAFADVSPRTGPHRIEPARVKLAATLEDHDAGVKSFAVSRDSLLLATGDASGVILVRDLRRMRIVHRIKAKGGAVVSLDFSPDRKFLAAGTTGKDVFIWDLSSELEMVGLKGYAVTHLPVRFSPDGKTLAFRLEAGVVGL